MASDFGEEDSLRGYLVGVRASSAVESMSYARRRRPVLTCLQGDERPPGADVGADSGRNVGACSEGDEVLTQGRPELMVVFEGALAQKRSPTGGA